jgi:hypothetical protein
VDLRTDGALTMKIFNIILLPDTDISGNVLRLLLYMHETAPESPNVEEDKRFFYN